MGIKVLSLFDGMACGHIAFNQLGMDIEKYYAYEIDKYAIQVSKHNFPDIEECGDVFKEDFTKYDGTIDWLIGGSPCTYWSIAQKNNRETEASGLGWELFSQYVRALHEAKPKYFLYENNKSMSKQIRASIDSAFGFEAIGINSALVSAQNRQRLYWVGIRQKDGTYCKANIEHPADRGILLKDVLDNAMAWQEKSFALTNRCQGAVPEDTLMKHRHTMVAEPSCMRYERTDEAKLVRKAYESHEVHHGFHELSEMHPRTDGKTNTLSTVLKDNPICEPVRVGCMPSPDGTLKGSQANRVYGIDGKSVNLLGQGGGAGAKTGLYAVSITITKDGKSHTLKAQYFKNGIANFICNSGFDATAVAQRVCIETNEQKVPIYEVNNGLIAIKDKQYPIKLSDGFYIIRKLTVNECKRLQTVPDWYDMTCISNSQAYKCLGNGWTVEVIIHLIQSALNN